MKSPPIALSLPFGAVPAVSTFEAPAQGCYIEYKDENQGKNEFHSKLHHFSIGEKIAYSWHYIQDQQRV